MVERLSQGLFSTYFTTKSTIIILVVNIFLSLGISSTLGIVPEILQDRYARIYHSYDGPVCSNYEHDVMPEACKSGADDAQAGSAIGSLVLNIITLFSNPIVGSLSDIHGRRYPIITGMFLCTLPPLVLVLMQTIPSVEPVFYYAAISIVGFVNYMAIFIASISDVVPEELRAPSIAIMLAGFYASSSLAPALPLLMSHFYVSLLALFLTVLAFFISFFFLPETLPDPVANNNRQPELLPLEQTGENCSICGSIATLITLPFQKVAILNRNTMMRLLTIGSFFSSMVFSADVNLALFYIEAHLNFRDKDFARLFFVSGCVGIVMQAFLLQPFIKCLGEKWLLVATFLCGSIHNLFYGISKDKKGIWAAFILSQFTHLSYPLLTSFASKGASESEQGQVQGALSAVTALAAALGPIVMQSTYDLTKDTIGPGTMFIFASLMYFIGTIVVSFLQVDKLRVVADEARRPSDSDDSEEGLLQPLSTTNEMEEPLI